MQHMYHTPAQIYNTAKHLATEAEDVLRMTVPVAVDDAMKYARWKTASRPPWPCSIKGAETLRQYDQS